MNEKITELMKQATEIVGVEQGLAFDREQLNVEKFAELIVREFASILRDSDFRLEAYERGADDNCDVGAMFGAEAIEEHFGIKE